MTFAGYLIFGIYTTFFVFMWAKIFKMMKIKAILREEGKKQEELIRKLETKNRKEVKFFEIKDNGSLILKRGEKIPIVDFHPDKKEIYFRGKKVGTAKQQNNEFIDVEFDNDFLMKYGYPSSYRLPYE